MKLSRKETEYRIKFIQECNYDKAEQKIFDTAKIGLNKTYKSLYRDMRNGIRYIFMLQIQSNRVSQAWGKVGCDTATFVDTAKSFAHSTRRLTPFLIEPPTKLEDEYICEWDQIPEEVRKKHEKLRNMAKKLKKGTSYVFKAEDTKREVLKRLSGNKQDKK